ncbi:hypothetical protein BSONL12_14336 [Bacillus sonorensis L12]|uniref:Uncharacterized protein n=1 Tax=Bacillus sonorensis L12 TaxID=1274524 RepID=M5PCU5_9BACI|nr:hypothetical protein BSONL12_14336 [Bacillus sonorensis L12]
MSVDGLLKMLLNRVVCATKRKCNHKNFVLYPSGIYPADRSGYGLKERAFEDSGRVFRPSMIRCNNKQSAIKPDWPLPAKNPVHFVFLTE